MHHTFVGSMSNGTMVTHVVNKLEVVKYLTKVYGTNKGDIHNIPAVGKTTRMIIIANHYIYCIVLIYH